jgi:hypothetical protein
MAVSSSPEMSKSKTSMFSVIRLGLVDLGMTERPCYRPQRSITCAGVLSCAVAMSTMTAGEGVTIDPQAKEPVARDGWRWLLIFRRLDGYRS